MVPKVVPEIPGVVKTMQKSPKRVQKQFPPAHPQHFEGKMVPRGGPRDPKRVQKSMKNQYKMLLIARSVSEPRFWIVFHGFLVDFAEKRSQNLHVFN